MLPSVLLLLLVSAWGAGALSRLQEQFKWRSVDFAYPSAAARAAALRSEEFVPGNAVPLDVDVYQAETGQRVFLTFPRLKPGVPATVTTIGAPASDGRTFGGFYGTKPTVASAVGTPAGAPAVTPFPDWSWNRYGDCDALVSVFRIQVDQSCGRLWVLDTGRVDILNTFDRICTSKLVLFDLRAGDRLIRKHAFSEDALPMGSLPVTVAVDVRGSTPHACGTAFAYVADVTGYGLVVYDLQSDKSWRVNHKHFFPYPTSGTFTISGTSFDLMDGVLGLALSPPVRGEVGGERRLYFHALASVREAWVGTGLLRNASLFADGTNAAKHLFRLSEGERSSQAAAQAMDANGVLFFSLLSPNSLNCWVAATGAPYASRSIVELDQDNDALQFASGLKVVTGRDGAQEVWLLTNRFQKLMTPEGQDPNEENFRVLRAPVRTLVKGTKCDVRLHRYQGGFGGSNSAGTAPIFS